ncbi:MAG: hypothetical protein FWE76_04935 [Symbiobacteriaceae bacterium]|nr:hypothetical protein [Symbiobacteriaceae bacterium]
MTDEEKILPEAETTEEDVSPTYGGSGENRNPSRMLKIEELVQWDMEFGVTIGPAGYDHRLRCPYCGKRMLLNFHEGGREMSGIRIAYVCESCGAHTLISFTPPGHRFEVPEISFGERLVVAQPAPVPGDPVAGKGPSDRQGRRDRQGTPRNQAAQAPSASSPSPNPPANAGPAASPSTTPPARPQQPRQQQRSSAVGERSGSQRTSGQQNTPQQGAGTPPQPRSQTGSEDRTHPPQPGSSQGRRGQQSGANPRNNEQRNQQRVAPTPAPTPSPQRPPGIQEISETVQDQADKVAAKAPSYHRRRRRPFRPPTSK